MLNKRGVVSITTFSLIILILLLILGFSYIYYTKSETETILLTKKQGLLYSTGSFRNELINIIAYENSNLTYSNDIDSKEISITLTNNTIAAKEIYKGQESSINISALGIKFCNNYTFYPNIETIFNFNGSCVSIIT